MPGLVSWRILRAVIWPLDAAGGAGSSWPGIATNSSCSKLLTTLFVSYMILFSNVDVDSCNAQLFIYVIETLVQAEIGPPGYGRPSFVMITTKKPVLMFILFFQKTTI